MFDDKRINVTSLEQLISSLEHIEEMQFHSDIRANVRCELKRMRRNISAVLSFVSQSSRGEVKDDNGELRRALDEVRRQCLAINGMITKCLILQYSPSLKLSMKYSSRVLASYEDMVRMARQMCQIAAPQFTEALAKAL
ncbi:MAG: hypothetical protein ACE14M_14880 [Terriglobales bacterium]